MVSNKKLGNTFEREIAHRLYAEEMWVYNCPQTNGGQQPADLIVVDHGTAYLMDCKVCSGNYFSKDRIEPNQWHSMKDFEECGGRSYFVVLIHGEVFMLAFERVSDDTMNYEWFKQNCSTLEVWLNASDPG